MFRVFTVLVLLFSSSPAFAEQLSLELECYIRGNLMKKDWRDKFVSVESFDFETIHISIKDSQLIPEDNGDPIDLSVTDKRITLPRGFVYEFDNLAITEFEIDRYTGTIWAESAPNKVKDSYLRLDGQCKKAVEKKRLF